MNTTHHACNYAILRYLPERERGEFVNIGLVLCCEEPRLFDFLMEGPRMPERVKALFPHLAEDVFMRSIAAMHVELDRIEARLEKDKTPQACKLAFQELVRPRESVLRFGEIRTFMASEPTKAVEELFRRYVKMENGAVAVSGS